MTLDILTHPDFSRDELSRYSRQLLLPEWGAAGQLAMRKAKVVIIGAGGLGCPAARYLAASGLGRLHLIDDDTVSLTNLHRQLLFYPEDVDRPKAQVAAERLGTQFPTCEVTAKVARVAPESIAASLEGADVVIDATDNFASRYLINDACVRMKLPLCHASIGKFTGQASVFAPGGPCYRCLFPEPPPAGTVPSCDVAGVIGVLPGVMGLIQATEAIKLITGIGTPLIGKVLLYDSLAMGFPSFALAPVPDCPACGAGRLSTQPIPSQDIPASVRPDLTIATIDAARLATSVEQGAVLVDVREPEEQAIVALTFGSAASISLPASTLTASPQRRDHPALSALARHSTDTPLIVVCKTGVRARKAARVLGDAGFADVRVLAGGITAYQLHQGREPIY